MLAWLLRNFSGDLDLKKNYIFVTFRWGVRTLGPPLWISTCCGFFFIFVSDSFVYFQVEDEVDEIGKKEFEKLENQIGDNQPPQT